MKIIVVYCIILLLNYLKVSSGFTRINDCCNSKVWSVPKISNQRLRRSRTCHYSIHDKDEDTDDTDDEYSDMDIDISKFSPPTSFYGLNRGRSAPGQRKAMAKKSSSSTTVHICTKCGSESVKWMGRCPTCREWNTMQKFEVGRSAASLASPRPSFSGPRASSSWLGNDHENTPVRVTDIYGKNKSGENSEHLFKTRGRISVPNDDELNTVLGGGIMSGSLTILGGDPGVGKSTLFLQTAGAIASLATPNVGIGMGLPESDGIGPVWYVSGEESLGQIASRASRLGIQESELWLLCETHVDTLCDQVTMSYQIRAEESETAPGGKPKPPSLLIIDSIQTMVCEAGGTSNAGGITQVRECVALFLRLAKSTDIPIFLIGHVTKSGDVAGPRTIEHMVDCVMYLEGGDQRTVGGVNLRMLRAAKNRFGSADEVGVYEMTAGRLVPVSDRSALLLSERVDIDDNKGTAVS